MIQWKDTIAHAETCFVNFSIAQQMNLNGSTIADRLSLMLKLTQQLSLRDDVISPSAPAASFRLNRHSPPGWYVFVGGTGGRVLVTGTPDPPPLEFSFVSQGGMINIPLTGTGKLPSRHNAV